MQAEDTHAIPAAVLVASVDSQANRIASSTPEEVPPPASAAAHASPIAAVAVAPVVAAAAAAVAPGDESDDDDAASVDDGVDESVLTPAELESLRAARRERVAAKNRAKKAKKKAAIDAAKKRKRDEQEAKAKASGRAVKPKLAPTPPAAKAEPPAATTFGLAAILGHKNLRGGVIDQSKPMMAAGGAEASAAAAAAAVASSAASAAASSAAAASPSPSSSPPPSFGMSLSEWRAMSADRAELSMSVIGEDVTAAKLAEKRAAAEAGRLTGMGGGFKANEGWACQSYNCTRHVNFKNDVNCKKCGAARRY